MRKADQRISSFEKKPARPGTPAMARQPMNIVRWVTGMCLRSPPIFRMSCSPDMAWMTEPEPRNRSALKKACVIRWKTPAAKAPTPQARNIEESWLTVEEGTTRLMSVGTSPMEAAKNAVRAPTRATTNIALGAWEKMADER